MMSIDLLLPTPIGLRVRTLTSLLQGQRASKPKPHSVLDHPRFAPRGYPFPRNEIEKTAPVSIILIAELMGRTADRGVHFRHGGVQNPILDPGEIRLWSIFGNPETEVLEVTGPGEGPSAIVWTRIRHPEHRGERTNTQRTAGAAVARARARGRRGLFCGDRGIARSFVVLRSRATFSSAETQQEVSTSLVSASASDDPKQWIHWVRTRASQGQTTSRQVSTSAVLFHCVLGNDRPR